MSESAAEWTGCFCSDNSIPGDPDVGIGSRIAVQMIQQGHQLCKISLRAVVVQENTVVDPVDDGDTGVGAEQEKEWQ